jgi:hypothetical protein
LTKTADPAPILALYLTRDGQWFSREEGRSRKTKKIPKIPRH